MMPLRPNSQFDLNHRAYFLRGAPGQPTIVAAAEDGQYSIIDAASGTVRSCNHSTTLRAIALHPTRPWLALVDNGAGSLVVQTLVGEPVAELFCPELEAGSPSWVTQGYGDCFFDKSGEFLWLAATLSADECEIVLVETSNWSVVDKARIQDPFGGSYISFHETGRPGLLALWLAAGQDGQQVYWLERNGGSFSCKMEGLLENTTPPVFSPSRDEFIVLDEDYFIQEYAFPSMNRAGDALESDDEDIPFAESIAYLTQRQVLVGTGEGRIFLINTDGPRLEDEISLEGHEPRPIGEYYPALSHENGLATDITWFTKVGQAVIFVCRRNQGTDGQGWKDSLLWYSPE